MYYKNKNNENIYQLVKTDDQNTTLQNVQDKTVKVVALSTLKRHYQVVDYAPKQQTKYPYYKSYQRNKQPLWNTQTTDGILYIKNQNGDNIIKCTISKSGTCIRVEQVQSKGKRYFSDFDRAKKHVLYDQDINTIKHIGSKFDQWIKSNKK